MFEIDIDKIAIDSLLTELNLEKKPGLVCPSTNGSHLDMNYDIMKNGIMALEGYFGKAFLYGFFDKKFIELRELGIFFEEKMLKATNGVNTHKGAIFSLGILSFLVGKIFSDGTVITHENFEMLVNEKLAHEEFDVLVKEGDFGARSEVISGYKHSFSGLEHQILKRLYFLIYNLKDTNVIRRGGEKKAEEFRRLAKNSFETGNYDDTIEFALVNFLSPGGAADILINSIFIDKLLNYIEERSKYYLPDKLNYNEQIYGRIVNNNILVFSLVFPGLIKDIKIFREFYLKIEGEIRKKFNLDYESQVFTDFGYYTFYDLKDFDFDRVFLMKKEAINLEKIGLIDLDFYFNGEPVSRKSLGLPERKCILCENVAKNCYVNRIHKKSELIKKSEVLIMDYMGEIW
ncbi:MAG: triphosphoribosyl-dephospho-CoA synthase [Ezakiella sp.]|nr:triphosphoribosyl-dephospho-CoA synthase [Ezakiella sp.]MDD7471229.1 triphosphoribosyl-dephospho-CoA synthase [Bacillota bacterium]MDY3923366.1 triphosphoribosyl-dephospho-CoA synthase [Ezakiella sp.]